MTFLSVSLPRIQRATWKVAGAFCHFYGVFGDNLNPPDMTSEVQMQNKHIHEGDVDTLYHFGFGTDSINIPATFGDTKFVCCGGSPGRFKLYATWFSQQTGLPMSENLCLSDRFVIYKTGPVCWINHGMGIPSLSIMLVESLKLMSHAGAHDVKFIRLGTSGGIGVEPGTLVISKGAMNAEMDESFVQIVKGKRVKRDCKLDEGMAEELVKIAEELKIPSTRGLTMAADDFYEGQMRLDGYFCDYESDDKFEFLKEIHEKGVRNIEMEATLFSAYTLRAGVKAAIVCVALLNRMNGDQVNIPKEVYIDYEERPFRLVTALIRRQLSI